MTENEQTIDLKEQYVVEIITSLECEEPLDAFIETHIEGASGWVFDQQAEADTTACNIYFDQKPDIESVRIIFDKLFAQLHVLGLKTAPAQVTMKTIEEADWTEIWKAKFRSIVVGDRLVLKPSWEKWEAKDDEIIIEFEPGLAFGTGEHPTTRFCLEVLERYSDRIDTVLDIGCGSAILCIAAAKLGAKEVYGFDIDHMAIEHAKKMVQKNMVESTVKIDEFDLNKLEPTRTYDMVLANLYAELLVEHSSVISKMVKHDGLLALTGILYTKADMVKSAYEQLGMKIISSFSEKEWCCFLVTPE